jgi:hypothetical protein
VASKKIWYGSMIVVGTLLALLFSAQAPLGRLVWPADASAPEPSSAQLAGFMAYGGYEALGFGLGLVMVTQLVLAVRGNRRAPGGSALAVASLGWLLLSWVPHDNLHQMVGMDPAGLLALEWGFHSTLILATFVVARFVYRRIQDPTMPAARPQPTNVSAPVRG